MVAAVARHLADVPAEVAPILDLHLWDEGDPGEVEAVGNGCGARSGRPDSGGPCTASTSPSRPSRPTSDRRSPITTASARAWDGLVEDMLYRNLHPMLAKRLNLSGWAGSPSPGSTPPRTCTCSTGCRDNPKDERLFVLAEVRDLTPCHDESGQVVGFPLLERILTETLSAIRRFQSHRPPEQRLLDNLVLLYVRPPWNGAGRLWRDLAHKLAPAIRGLGIDRLVVRVRIARR